MEKTHEVYKIQGHGRSKDSDQLPHAKGPELVLPIRTQFEVSLAGTRGLEHY